MLTDYFCVKMRVDFICEDEWSIFDELVLSAYSVDTIDDCIVLLISASIFKGIVRNRPLFRRMHGSVARA